MTGSSTYSHMDHMVLVATQEVCDLLAKSATRVEQLFRDMDKNGNGLIDKREFRAACVAMGIIFPHAVLDQVFDQLDEDRSGQLDQAELIRTARKAAFSRGFVPKATKPRPRAGRRLDAYWARRNRMHIEEHEQEIERQVRAEESRQVAARDERREDRLNVIRARQERARELAINRQERYWVAREREQQREQKVQEVLADTMRQPVRFLPQLPEAARLAKATWAKDPTRIRTPDRDESIREVERLNDVWVGSIIEKWKKPSAEEAAANAFKSRREKGKGRAPSVSAFRGMQSLAGRTDSA